MDTLYKIYIKRETADNLSVDNIFLAQPYDYDYKSNQYKMKINIGGIGDFRGWYRLEDFVPVNDFIEDFFIKDLDDITNKQRTYIYWQYKGYLENGGYIMETLKTREAAELFGITINKMHTFLAQAIPEELKPKNVDSQDGGYGYLFTDKDIEVLSKAIEYKETMTYKKVKDKLAIEYHMNERKKKPKETKTIPIQASTTKIMDRVSNQNSREINKKADEETAEAMAELAAMFINYVNLDLKPLSKYQVEEWPTFKLEDGSITQTGEPLKEYYKNQAIVEIQKKRIILQAMKTIGFNIEGFTDHWDEYLIK